MRLLLATGFVAGFISLSNPVSAQIRPSTADSFRLGSEGAALCTAQMRAADELLESIFDRGYAIVCRDAAEPVGHVYALRDASQAETRLTAGRAEEANCETPVAADLEDLGQVWRYSCQLTGSAVGYTAYQWKRGDTLYAVQGLAGYDSALKLALRSVALDRIVPGDVAIATHRGRRSRRLRRRPGRRARRGPGADRGLSPQQRRQLCRSRRILRNADPPRLSGGRSDRPRTRRRIPDQRGAAIFQPRPLRGGRGGLSPGIVDPQREPDPTAFAAKLPHHASDESGSLRRGARGARRAAGRIDQARRTPYRGRNHRRHLARDQFERRHFAPARRRDQRAADRNRTLGHTRRSGAPAARGPCCALQVDPAKRRLRSNRLSRPSPRCATAACARPRGCGHRR